MELLEILAMSKSLIWYCYVTSDTIQSLTKHNILTRNSVWRAFNTPSTISKANPDLVRLGAELHQIGLIEHNIQIIKKRSASVQYPISESMSKP